MVRLNNATVIVVNVGKSSGDVLEDGTTTELDASKRAVRELLQYHMLNRAKDEIAIVLCGCDETSNVLNQEDGESYKRLKVLGNVGALDRACTDIILLKFTAAYEMNPLAFIVFPLGGGSVMFDFIRFTKRSKNIA